MNKNNLLSSVILFSAFIFITNSSFAQVAINTDGTQADPSAMLDIKSSDRGLLIPRVDTSAINLPKAGLMTFQPIDNGFYFFNGETWQILGTVETIRDADNDTKIQVEESPDEDIIRFDVAGEEAMIIDNYGQVGINKQPESRFHVDLGVDTDEFKEVEQLLGGTSYQNGNLGWQSFTSLSTSDLSEVRLFFGTVNTPIQRKLKIYSGEGVSGTLIYESGSFIVDSNQWVSFIISGVVPLVEGNKYTLALDNRNSWEISLTDPYADGTANVNSGDYVFEIYTTNIQLDGFRLGDELLAINDYHLPTRKGESGQVIVMGSGSSTEWGDAVSVPVGTVVMWAGDGVPQSWVKCDGASITDYPDLVNVLNSNNAPDFRGRMPLGVGTSGTTGATTHSLGSAGGQEKVALTIAQLPAHVHGAGSLETSYPYKSSSDTGTSQNKDGSDTQFYNSSEITGFTGSTGSGANHQNMPPFRTIYFIIKAVK